MCVLILALFSYGNHVKYKFGNSADTVVTCKCQMSTFAVSEMNVIESGDITECFLNSMWKNKTFVVSQTWMQPHWNPHWKWLLCPWPSHGRCAGSVWYSTDSFRFNKENRWLFQMFTVIIVMWVKSTPQYVAYSMNNNNNNKSLDLHIVF